MRDKPYYRSSDNEYLIIENMDDEYLLNARSKLRRTLSKVTTNNKLYVREFITLSEMDKEVIRRKHKEIEWEVS